MHLRFPLNPTQEAMLLHHLAGGERGVDVEQMVCVLREPISVGALAQAWQAAAERHDALRTHFDWSASPVVQVIGEPSVVTPEPIDWSGLPQEEQTERLQSFLLADRLRGFALDTAPLMRLSLIKLGQHEFKLVWSFHHMILDGRSFTLVLDEVFTHYDALTGAGHPAMEFQPAPRFSEYISWLTANRDETAARRFWSKSLAGFTAPTPIAVLAAGEVSDSAAGAHGNLELELETDAMNRLRRLAERCNVTIGSVVQAAWALLLHRYSGVDDIVFGTTRACRHVPVESAERMVGVFINTLPLRIQVDPHRNVREFLQDVRARFVEARPFEHTPLASIHAWSEVTGGAPLFETLLVFENYDLTESFQRKGGRWAAREFHLHEQTNYAVTLYGYAGSKLRLKLSFARHRMSPDAAQRLLGHVATILADMAADADRSLESVSMLSAAESRQLVSEWNDTHTELPDTASIHGLIEARTAQGPGAAPSSRFPRNSHED